MSPSESAGIHDGQFVTVAWDLDTTGRRLIDEICQVAGFYTANSSEFAFSQYVMPHKNPNPGARRSFGIKVSSMGRYRMLKDVETGKVLKTKSEVSALTDFLHFLKEAKGNSDGVILVCHEAARKVLIPLFLESLRRYNLLDDLEQVVVAFANSVNVVEAFADPAKVTSLSLRSLCKTLLSNTNPATASACDRARVLVDILSKCCPGADGSRSIDSSKLRTVATSVNSELEEVLRLKSVLSTQGTLRPIFEGELKQKRALREHALGLRKLVAEAGLGYGDLSKLYKSEAESRQKQLKTKISEASDKDIDDLIAILDKHFINNENSANAAM